MREAVSVLYTSSFNNAVGIVVGGENEVPMLMMDDRFLPNEWMEKHGR
jgi:hypothetical protein